jgi:cytochrome c biogenesis protein CcmG, thiol:disulfide interchange protein DsbE
MQKSILFFLVFTLGIASTFAQNKQHMPSIDVKKLDGSVFNTGKLSNEGKPMLVDFWATWCGPCKAELNAIADLYSDWQKETGVKLVAVSIDDARNMEKVGPYVNGKNWEYEVLLDPNGDLKRAMNVNNVPHIFLLDGKGDIVWQQNSSSPGDEEKIYELVKKVAKGEEIK